MTGGAQTYSASDVSYFMGMFDDNADPNLTKRRRKFKTYAEKAKRDGIDANFCIFTDSGEMKGTFSEFSGRGGAKWALDNLDFPVKSAIVRLSDGVELAYKGEIYRGGNY